MASIIPNIVDITKMSKLVSLMVGNYGTPE